MAYSNTSPERMTPLEFRAAVSLAGIFLMRMLGIFMIIPVLPLYASQLEGATPTLVGLAIGIYGLTQALLQILFGSLSDRYGRRPLIAIGLGLFAFGSIIAALSSGIYGIIIGRSLQGAGAIGAVIMALAADLTRADQRQKTMAIIGISMGVSFALAFILGPLLNAAFGLHGLFWVATLLAGVAVIILYKIVPADPDHNSSERRIETQQLLKVLRDPTLLRLNLGIFFLHLVQTASFIVLPIILRDELMLISRDHWKVYLPVLLVSVLLIMPFLRRRDNSIRPQRPFIAAIVLLILSELGFYTGHNSWIVFIVMLLLFFTAFNYLEANLPALISRAAPVSSRGTALGAFSMAQFIGIFIGGALGGWLHEHISITSVFLCSAIIALAWLFLCLQHYRDTSPNQAAYAEQRASSSDL